MDLALSIHQTADSGYIMGGYSYSYGSGGQEYYLIKTDRNGDTLWTKSYGGLTDDAARSVQQTTDGGYMITGTSTSFGVSGYDVFMVKTDASGNMMWTKTYGGTGTDIGYDSKQTPD